MAQREGQGLQIAVISFAMLTIILAITTYVFYAQSQTAQKDLEAKTKNLNEKQSEVNKLKYQVATMQYVLGVKDVNLQDVDLAEKTAGGAAPSPKKCSTISTAIWRQSATKLALTGPRAIERLTRR